MIIASAPHANLDATTVERLEGIEKEEREREARSRRCVGCGKPIAPDAMRGTVTICIDFYDSPEQHKGAVCSFDCAGKALRSFADAWDAAAPKVVG